MPEITGLRAEIRREEEISIQHTKLFTKEWWAGKIDRPCKEMFKMLKVKQRQEFIPLLKSNDGVTVPYPSSNKKLLVDYFQNILNETEPKSSSKLTSMATISKARTKTVSPALASILDQDLSHEEIKKAITTVKTKKSPGQDGLPAEFHQTFSDKLIQPILEVWKESIHHGALPSTINEGIINLIHKRGLKDEIGN